MARFREILKNKNFLLLWLGQVISNFGDRLNQMALVALVYQKSPGSEIALAKLISFTIIPVFIICPIAGAWVDRLNRRNIMVISDVLRGALVLTIPLFIMARQILPVYLVIFLVFSISRFFIPSKMAMIPDIVPKDKLLVANTLQDTTHMIGNVVGLVVAGVIVNLKGVGAIGGFYIDSASFFVSAFLIAMIAYGAAERHRVKEDIAVTGTAIKDSLRRSIFSEIKEGLKYLTRYTNMRFIICVFFLLMAGIGAVSCVIIVFVQDAFASATRDLGLLGMFLVGGLFCGTLIYGRFGQKVPKRMAIYLSFMATGLSVSAFTFFVGRYPDMLSASVLALLVGLAASPIMASTNTMTHETIPQEVRGRIFSSLEAVIHLAFILFMFAAAYGAKMIGRFWVLMAAGMIFSEGGAAGLLLDKKRSSTCP